MNHLLFAQLQMSCAQATELLGCAQRAKPVSKIGHVGAIPTTPAIYVDDATGKQVSEDWWPGDEHDAP